MKTFEQFLTEATKPGSFIKLNKPGDDEGALRATAKEPQRHTIEREERLAELPPKLRGTSSSLLKAEIDRKIAAQKAEKAAQQAAKEAAERAQQESQAKLAKASEALAAQKQDPAYKEQQNKLAKARERSARRAAKKANP